MITSLINAFTQSVKTVKESPVISAIVAVVICVISFASYTASINNKRISFLVERAEHKDNEEKASLKIGIELERLRNNVDADRALVRLFVYDGEDQNGQPKYIVTKYSTTAENVMLPIRAYENYDVKGLKNTINKMWFSDNRPPICYSDYTKNALDTEYKEYLQSFEVTSFTMCPLSVSDNRKLGFLGIGYINNQELDVIEYTKETRETAKKVSKIFEEYDLPDLQGNHKDDSWLNMIL